MVESIEQHEVQVLAVIVLYKVKPIESAAFRTLMAGVSDLQQRQNRIRVLLYDNTPGGRDPGSLPEGVQYEAAGRNAGLAQAYNRALAIAQREECRWLLVLDQDTTLPPDYLSRMSQIALDIESNQMIAAIVPRVHDANRPVSPVSVRFWGVSYIAPGFEGVAKREVQATNSASLFRVSALKQIGGFSSYFWLDYADGYVFRQLHLRGMKVYVAKDIQVEHELSLLHGRELTPDRYRNVLRAESAFSDLYGAHIQGFALTGRLLCRIWRQRKRGHSVAILQLTRNELKRRILQPRARRIREWKSEMQRLMLSASAGMDCEYSEERSAISVCMATYNGSLYIHDQLESILNQLEENDEVIVVDDASTDGTGEIVRSFEDGRIRLIEHNQNVGVSHTFEEAIRAASGEIVFLSDQDDLWVPNKVSTVLRVLQLNPEVDIAVSDAELIDEHNAPLGPSYYAQRGRFQPGVLANVFRSSYLGCVMAFRSRIRGIILPFPVEKNLFHDLWIGASTSLAGGRTLYVDLPLVLYRRHEGNVTGNKRLGIGRQILIRWALCRSLAALWMTPHSCVGGDAKGPS